MIIENNLYHCHHSHLLGRQSQAEIIVVIYSHVLSNQFSPWWGVLSLSAGARYVLIPLCP